MPQEERELGDSPRVAGITAEDRTYGETRVRAQRNDQPGDQNPRTDETSGAKAKLGGRKPASHRFRAPSTRMASSGRVPRLTPSPCMESQPVHLTAIGP